MLGAEISVEEGYRRARLVGLGLLAAMREGVASLDRVDFVEKLLGMVNAVPDFTIRRKLSTAARICSWKSSATPVAMHDQPSGMSCCLGRGLINTSAART